MGSQQRYRRIIAMMKKTDTNHGKHSVQAVYAKNRKARFDYNIEQTFECGLVLHGWEVKSIRAGLADLSGAYVLFKEREAFLFGLVLNPPDYIDLNAESVDKERVRKLLLHRHQLRTLIRARKISGQSCIALDLHQGHSHRIKATIALATGRKKADKRALLKQRDWEKTKKRVIKQFNNPMG